MFPETHPKWRWFALVGAGIVVVGFAWTYNAGATPPSWYPPCPLYALTRLYCPGCGSSRTLHALAHGDIHAALGFNILVVITLPLLALYGVVAFWRGVVHKRPPPALPSFLTITTLVVILLFGIARNIPCSPFSLLAPTPVQKQQP